MDPKNIKKASPNQEDNGIVVRWNDAHSPLKEAITILAIPALINCCALFINVDWSAGLFLEYNDPATQEIELKAKTAKAIILRVELVSWLDEEILPFKNRINPMNPMINPDTIGTFEK